MLGSKYHSRNHKKKTPISVNITSTTSSPTPWAQNENFELKNLSQRSIFMNCPE